MPRITNQALRHGNDDYLMECALNYARQNGFEMKRRRLRSDPDVASLMKELSEKGKIDVRLIRDDEGAFHIETYNQANRDYTLYYIPIGPSYHLRDEAGELTRRFLKALADRFNIDVIMDVPLFDYEMSAFDDQIETQEQTYKRTKDEDDKPENFFGPGWMEFHQMYKEGGLPYQRLTEFRDIMPLTEEELDRFKPADETEENLVRSFHKGFELMRTDVNIWDQRDSLHFSESEMDEMMNNGVVNWEDQFLISYDQDDFLDCFIDNLNSQIQSGAVAETIVWGGRLPESGTPDLKQETADILEYIDDLTGLLSDLKDTKKKTTKETS